MAFRGKLDFPKLRLLHDGNWWNFPAVDILQISPKIPSLTAEKKVKKQKKVVVELKNTELPKPKQQSLMLKLNYDDIRNTWSDRRSPLDDDSPLTDVPENDVTKKLSWRISRRSVGAITCLILGGEGILRTQIANAFELKFVAPDRTVEEALSEVRDHAKDLLQVRDLLELESWKAAQKTLRLSSALLKKDIYIIIQSKPGIERSELRKLYSTLFNNVTRLDYAARDKDGPQVWQCYENIVVAVNDILSRI